MRLINTQTLQLEDFTGQSAPPYAILSHTWEQDEVSFREMEALSKPPDEQTSRDRAVVNKAGYAKIRKCAQVAAQEGFAHVWVDTCCIDKSSSAELSEAINSMYSWYKKAQLCYAFLADVPDCSKEEIERLGFKRCDREDPLGRRFPWLRDYAPQHPFYYSRWFTRGWTLQELLAPKKLIFYSKDWNPISMKSGISRIVCYTTGIREKVILTGDFSTTSIATRMSWAAQRSTTRIEDTAYCLLGIFGIHMPLLYGEGEAAFVRLQEEIARTSDDYTLLAWRAQEMDDSKSASAFRGLLAKSPSEFAYTGSEILPVKEPVTLSITNRGYNITLPLIPVSAVAKTHSLQYNEPLPALATSKDEFWARLPCHWDMSNSRPMIRLKRLSPKDDQFVRVQCNHLQRIWHDPSNPGLFKRVKPQTVCIRQIPVVPMAYMSQRIGAVSVRNLSQHLEDSIQIRTFDGDWNPETRLIRFSPPPKALIAEFAFPSLPQPHSILFGIDPVTRTPQFELLGPGTGGDLSLMKAFDQKLKPMELVESSYKNSRWLGKDQDLVHVEVIASTAVIEGTLAIILDIVHVKLVHSMSEHLIGGGLELYDTSLSIMGQGY